MESVVKFFPRNPRIVELGEYQKKLARAAVMEEPPVAIQVGEIISPRWRCGHSPTRMSSTCWTSSARWEEPTHGRRTKARGRRWRWRRCQNV